MILPIKGRIDSANAAQVEQALQSQISGQTDLVLDAQELEYISSAGLRVILRIRKEHPELRIVNVNSEVYEILEMTGFTEMMSVEKAYRVVSVDGAEEIGRGANGTIYRIDKDNVVKVYNNPEALSDIQHEREVAKLALILGIPTAISYDVVKVGDSYGSVFELLNARSFAKILAREPEKLDWCVAEFAKMLRLIHGTEVPAGKLPDMRERALDWASFMKDYLPEDAAQKLYALVAAVPHDDHMLHGDYHTRNLELQNDEVLLIDMDTLSVGNPIFELGSMYNAFLGLPDEDPGGRGQGANPRLYPHDPPRHPPGRSANRDRTRRDRALEGRAAGAAAQHRYAAVRPQRAGDRGRAGESGGGACIPGRAPGGGGLHAEGKDAARARRGGDLHQYCQLCL